MNTKTVLVLKAVAYAARKLGKVLLEVGTIVGILFVAFSESRGDDDSDDLCREYDEPSQWLNQQSHHSDWS
ncbi:hypothetical protein [Paraburkholderia youngii]|uniref:hypothetical protein n=1 Tax=Paraburkholderia youngii TaxID=2782701 RepID=UPI003D1F2726